MNEYQRINIQAEIIDFLSNRYYHLNCEEDEAHEMARKDSYVIMKIIKRYLEVEQKD